MASRQAKGKGRGWHGDSQAHAAAGRKGGLASRRRRQGRDSSQTSM